MSELMVVCREFILYDAPKKSSKTHMCANVSQRDLRNQILKFLVVATKPFYITHMWVLKVWARTQIFATNNNAIPLKHGAKLVCLTFLSFDVKLPLYLMEMDF